MSTTRKKYHYFLASTQHYLTKAILMSANIIFPRGNKKNIYLGPVFQSFVSLTSSLMTNLLTAVAMVFSNTLIFLLQKYARIFLAKNITVFAILQIRNLNVMSANNFVKL